MLILKISVTNSKCLLINELQEQDASKNSVVFIDDSQP